MISFFLKKHSFLFNSIHCTFLLEYKGGDQILIWGGGHVILVSFMHNWQGESLGQTHKSLQKVHTCNTEIMLSGSCRILELAKKDVYYWLLYNGKTSKLPNVQQSRIAQLGYSASII